MTRTDSMEDPVEKLLFEALEVIDREGDRGLEALCRDHPDRADALRRRLEALRDAGLAPGAADDDSFPERLGDFHLLDRLGQGGMGVVYRARQLSLGREVALKLVRPDLLYFPGARERFRREVETIGGLQHPGIVPIHTVGEENGIPFYAMELVRGVTLADVIRAVAEREPSSLSGDDFVRAIDPNIASGAVSPLFTGSWIEVVLRVVREVAESLEHAHRRGVIHRDVKPSNIMVTNGGRVLLLDFGLASTAGVDRVTRTGSQLGTLPYMSPEQLDGVDDLDARTDVYSLGAVLHELLTLDTPYQAKTLGELLTAIRTGAAPGMAKANPAVSWELDVVGRTALTGERERRYGSAAAFARDLDNVLEHRPIEARRTGPVRRFWRWSQRHPSAAIAIVLAFLAVLAGPAGWAVKAELSKRELETAYRKEQVALRNEQAALGREREALGQSEASYETALDALGYVLRTMAADDLRSSPTMQSVRLQAIDRALAVFDDLELQRAGDERVRFEKARIVSSRGEVLVELGRRDEALVELERAEKALTRLVEGGGEYAARARRARGLANHHQSSTLTALGRFDESRPAAERAVADLRAPEVQALEGANLELVAVLDLLSTQTYRQSEFEETERLLREALEIAIAAAKARPLDVGTLYREGRTHGKLGITLEELGRLDEALEFVGVAIERLQVCTESAPGDRVYKSGWAHYSATYGRLLGKLDRYPESLPYLERGLVLYEELGRDYPANEGIASELISTRTQVAMGRHADGDAVGVAELFAANVRDAQRMIEQQPDNPMFRYEAATQRHNQALLLIDADPEEADWRRFEELERASLDDARALLVNHPTSRSYRVLENRTAQGIAAARCELGTPAEARRAIDEFIDLGELDLSSVALRAQLWARWWLCLDRHEMGGDERERLQQEARSRMYDDLEHAVSLGLRQTSILKTSPVFEPFLYEPAFQRLMDEIEQL